MTIECLVADLTGYLFTIMPAGQADEDLTPERFAAIKHQVIKKLTLAERQVASDQLFAAHDAARDGAEVRR